MFEGPLSSASGQDFNLLSNTIWNIFVTMTTVGYGDFFPKTNIGRIVGIVVAFWGVFIVSLFVVSLSTMLQFDSGEEKAFELNNRLESKENLKVQAANVLGSAYRQRKVLKQTPVNKSDVLSAFRNFRKYMIKF
jgi:potassium intermediate/small conductance calcium-activated channel subfamily N protein 2